ncbi:MAG TPA: ABC transporter substrate-binding protein [Burkholderiales bacterium]|nr:ABC transporter substrate-binding protein [Burkholderiales bacterium]
MRADKIITYVVRIFLLLGCASALAQESIRVNAFPNAKALPLHVGVEKGIFAKHSLDVKLSFTENSTKQREGLAAGAFDLAHAAVDNAVAMVESGKDVVIVSGGDSGMNEFFVQPHIKSFQDLRGKTLVVDAPNTAYALVAKKILKKHGMLEGRDYTVKPVGRGELRLKAMAESRDNTAAILNLPFTIQAEQLGLKSLGNPVEMLGPYQAHGAFAMRDWVNAHERRVVRYVAAYIESLRWALAPANREDAVGILMNRLNLSRGIAERTMRALADPSRGFTPDAAFDHEGFRNMLALRAEMEGGRVQAPERYYEPSFYERALRRLDVLSR